MKINKEPLLGLFSVKEKKQMLVLLTVLLGVWGLLYIRYSWTTAYQAATDDALTIARTAETSFMQSAIVVLENPSPENIETSQYKQIKSSLQNLVKINQTIRFAYIYLQRDGKLYFMADSEPVDSKDYSQPGQEYEADKVYWEPFEDGKPIITHPETDRRGTWVSVLIPMKDAETGKVEAVFAMDYPAKMWGNDALYSTVQAAAVVLTLFLLILALFRILIKNEVVGEEQRKLIVANEEIIKAEFNYKAIADYAYDWETWEDGEGSLKYVSPACERISGYTVDEFVENGSILPSIIIDEDKEIWLNHRHNICSEIGVHSEQFRIKNKDGTIVWIEHTCRPVVDNKGTYLGYRANNRDITERKKAEDALKISEEKYRLLTENASDVIWVLNLTQNKFTYISPSIYYLRGFTAEEAMDQTLEEVLTPESFAFVKETSPKYMNDFLENSNDPNSYIQEIQQPCKNGDIIWVEISAKYRYNSVGEIEIVGVSRNIEERKKSEREVLYLSYHDQLTGLYNRRFYEEELKRLDTKRNLPLTIVMADVNGLKLINDSLGHFIGDELLKKVAEVMTKGCRADDIIARLGGDEFVIMLPKTGAIETERIIKRIKDLASIDQIGCCIDISITFGYKTKHSEEEKIQEVFKNAEDQMYKRKLFESPSVRGKTIKAIINTLHEKNKREEQHSHRVSVLCKSMGESLELPEHEIEVLKTVGLLHDIGKIAIDENVLNKPSKLTNDEWEEIKRHPEIGYRILNTVNDMSDIANYALYHHERWDGKGYPKGLKGDDIPFVSRIITIADAYDAMTSERSYRSALPEELVIEELKKNAGLQFDPELVMVFIEKVLVE